MVMRKVMLVVCLLALSLLLGCQEKQMSASLEKSLKQEQKSQLQSSIAAVCEGCDTRMTLDVPVRDILIARDPTIERPLYLTTVDKQGRPVECSKALVRIDVDGKLILKCLHNGQFNPVAVEDDKVVVE
jgi:hypothetical protein